MVSPLPEGEAGHAPLAPSDAYRWMACPGSIELRANLTPRPSGHAAERGTLMHSYAERCLKDEGLLDLAPLYEDEHEIVAAFVTYVNAMTRDRDLDTAVGVETRVSLAELHPHVWGTVDTFVWFWRKGKRHLTIIDFKSGRMPVRAAGNPQLVIYALGVLGKLDAWPDNLEVSLQIVQPRLQTMIDSAPPLDAEEMRQWAETVRSRATEASSHSAVRIPGNHCKYCAAAHKCPEFASQRYQAARGLIDLHGELDAAEALLAQTPDIREILKQVSDHPSDLLEVPTMEEIRWTRGGKTAFINRYGRQAAAQRPYALAQASPARAERVGRQHGRLDIHPHETETRNLQSASTGTGTK